MINLIIGLKGTGKTKMLIDEVNKAVAVSKGAVICIECGKKLTYDVKHQVRLIDAKDYSIDDGEYLYGFVTGILAGNYDVTELFIDSALKICGDDMEAFKKFMLMLAPVVEKYNVHCVITSSMAVEDCPEELKQFIAK